MARARLVAARVLVKIEKEGAFSNLAVAEALKSCELAAADKALATALIYGVLDRKITLDYILSKFLKTPVKKTAPFTLAVLRCALFQIKYMDKIPESAAVNEAVKLIKASNQRGNAGFVNGVLRTVLRTEVTLPKGESAEALSVRYSCPLWIVESFLSDYGAEDTKALLEESLRPAATVLRVNTVLTDKETVKKELDCRDGLVDNSLELKTGTDISVTDAYKKGYIYAQDYASQRAVAVLAPKPGGRVLDMCAAPGGKSFTMAGLMENKGEIVACDLYEHRVRLIEKSAKRLGLSIIRPFAADAGEYDGNLGKFDCILCDVPCSVLGVIRR